MKYTGFTGHENMQHDRVVHHMWLKYTGGRGPFIPWINSFPCRPTCICFPWKIPKELYREGWGDKNDHSARGQAKSRGGTSPAGWCASAAPRSPPPKGKCTGLAHIHSGPTLKALIVIPSQTAGTACECWANPVSIRSPPRARGEYLSTSYNPPYNLPYNKII
jgi:hypothetical protein